MARAFNGVSARIHGAAPVTGAPLTISAWVRFASLGGVSRAVLSLGQASGLGRVQLLAGASQMELFSVDAAGFSASSTAPLPSLNTWAHVAGVWIGANFRQLYVNGVAATANTTTVALPTLEVINLGARLAGGTPGLWLSGSLANVGVWNVALTADEIASLAKAISCDQIRPSALRFDPTLIREVRDLRGGLTLTDTGTTYAEHPRIYF